ncbi:hypothetical protein QYF36_002468 [Acer negundo]|nr:hypothetical protein QYF36_002468 [Acer negundo]
MVLLMGLKKHGPATVDGPPDVELHGLSDVNWVDNVVHAKVNKEAGEAEAKGEVEAQDDAYILVESDYKQKADDITAETCVDPTKIWDSLNVPNRSHEECASGFDLEDVSDELNSLEGSDGEKDIFRKAIRAHVVKHRRDVKFKKNDQHRIRAICKSEACNWFVYAFWLSDHKTFQIKTFMH